MLELNWLIVTLGTIPLLLWLYVKMKRSYLHWTIRGVPGPQPTFLLGNLGQIFKQNRGPFDMEMSQKYGKVYGYFMVTTPLLMITDPELIKQVLISDFRHFVTRRHWKTYHEMWNQNLFASEGEEWRRVRQITTPAFTPGKLRAMHRLMMKCVNMLVDHLDGLIVNGDGVIANTKEVMSAFTIDVIASTAFATETNANGTGPQSAFVLNGARLFHVNLLRVLASIILPKYALDLLNIKTIFDPVAFQFFIDLCREIVRKRKETGIKRNDFVQLLMDASIDESEFGKDSFDKLTASMELLDDDDHSKLNVSTSGKSLTESQIISQCIVFFSAGFQTTASTLMHCIYELAKNQDLQKKLYEAISCELKDLHQDSDEYFDKVNSDIPLLEATIKETLRMYPPVTVLTRVLQTDNYKLAGIVLPKGQSVEVSVYAVHHNPEYYPEPERFNPDRFMPEHKHLLTPYTYLPFGAGPRNCVGVRFAYQQLKLCLAKLLISYCFHPSEHTPKELTFKRGSPQLNTATFPIKVSKR